jgi:predicted dehydrogenase
MIEFDDTYGHTPVDKAFGGDVYGIGYDAERAARKPVRLGMIGAGGVAQSKYVPALSRLRMLWEPVELVAFSEPRADHGRKVEAISGARWYADHADMLARETLDGVLVLSSDTLHATHTLEAIRAGLPVLVEKPIARSLTDAAAMCRAADEAGVALMTVANKRYSPPYRRLKRLVESGPLRQPAMFVGKFNLGYDYVSLLESGTIHLFDLALFLMGPATSVSALGVNRYGGDRPAYPVDNVVITLEFASGAVGSLTTSATALSLKPWERVEIYANHAWAAVEDQHELIVYDSETRGAQSWRPVVPNTLLFDEEFGGYMGIVENFAQVIRGVETPLVTGWDGYRAYELLTATHLSLARRESVRLPLEPDAADEAVRHWLAV